MHNLDKLKVKSQFEPYEVTFSESFEEALLRFEELHEEIFFLIDDALLSFQSELIGSLTRPFLTIQAEESKKTIESVAIIYQWLLDQGATKASVIVAVGGGIVQDLATFVASTYYRGIRWHIVPSTLLSMSDSCIGGKCALNQGGFKNQIGLIWPPKSVTVIPGMLESLPENQIKSGYGEMLKLSLTGDGQFYDEFKSFVRLNGFAKVGALPLIRSSLAAKISIIEEDETETGLRRVLNYGHTFGHALEAASETSISHGEAIVLGMDLVNFLGVEYGVTSEGFAEDFRGFVLENFNLAALKEIARHHSDALFDLAFRDKKVVGKRLHLALARGPGDLLIHAVDLDQALNMLIKKYLNV